MRRLLAIALLTAMALGPSMAPPATAQDQLEDAHPPAQHARVTWENHFTQANLAHDGHLTLAEAKAGYPSVARGFHAIDVDGKGFVTENDIRAWKALQKANRAHAHDDPLRPRNAFQLNYSPARPMNTGTKQTVRTPNDKPQEPQHPDDAD
jgi:hypothetical protein